MSTTTVSGDEAGTGEPAGRATMREVAALAGVSLKTVSRVVNGEQGVSSELRERVQRAVARLDYRHNVVASNLRRRHGRTGVIGVLVQDVGNAFSAGVLRALEDVAHRHGSAVLAASLDEEAERERELVAGLVGRRVDALVLMPASERQDYLAAEVRAGLPIVCVDRTPRGIDVDAVTIDNAAAAAEAVRHLLGHGHRQVAALSDLARIQTAADRLRGYAEALASAGLRSDPRWVATDLRTEQAAARAVHAMLDLDEPPTAILATRNTVALGAVRALRARGARRSVALVAVDDVPTADLLEPGLSVVRQDVEQIGTTVGDLLFRRLAGDTGPPQHVVVPHRLVPRGSGEIRPSD